MTALSKQYRLRSVHLVNAGTNLGVHSGIITKLDPRGGAAVMGGNGVGKTTTLHMMTLLFGVTPTQLMAGTGRKDSVIGFMLPKSSSAIVFEYQRGTSEENDIRTVVVRRREEEPNVPFYRFYKCGFDKSLFTKDGRFLDDIGTQEVSSERGIQTTQKLTTAEYRHIILRSRSTGKEKRKLMPLQADFSFGPKSLDNLDLVVSSMLKERIEFEDVIQIVVDLVQNNLGMNADSAKLSASLNKSEVEKLRRNQIAVIQAQRLAPKVVELNELMKTYSSDKVMFDALSVAVINLKALKIEKRNAGQQAIGRIIEEREAFEKSASDSLRDKYSDYNAAHAKWTAAKAEAEAAVTRRDYFIAENAKAWELKTSNLSALESEVGQLTLRITTMEGSTGELERQYTMLMQDATASAEKDKLALEQGKEPHRVRLSEALATLSESNEASAKELVDEHIARRSTLDINVEQAVELKTRASAKVDAPRETPEAADALTKAFEKVSTKTTDYNDAAAVARASEAALADARAEYLKLEESVRMTERALDAAKAAVEMAMRNLTPEPGTLLATLKAQPDLDWTKTVARVINPELLARKDIGARYNAQNISDSVYGLELNLNVLETPSWCDDEQAKETLRLAQESVGATESRLASLIEQRKAKASAVGAAERLVATDSASATVAKQHMEAAKVEMGKARVKVEEERKHAKARAEQELAASDSQLKAARAAQTDELRRHKAADAALKKAHNDNVQAARATLAAALAGVDALIAEVQSKLVAQIAALKKDRDDALVEKAIDVEKLNGLKAQAVEQRKAISEIRSKDFLVKDWQSWAKAVGDAGVAQLSTAAEAANTLSVSLRTEVARLEEGKRRTLGEFESKVLAVQTVTKALDEDIQVISNMEEDLSINTNCRAAVLDENLTGSELRSRVNNDRRKRDASLKAVEQCFEYVRSSLVSGDNAVRDLIERSLAEVANEDLMVRAQMLSNRYAQSAPQVIESISTTLNAQLTLVNNLCMSIDRFEREVSGFNKKLSAGFEGIQRFDRLADLRVDIITNFEGLGFYAKLNSMKRVVREYRDNGHHENLREMPPAEIIDALCDFMASLAGDGSLNVNLASHITLRGQLSDNGKVKEFRKASELQSISSTGLSSLVLTTVLMALVNTIRGDEPVYLPFILDEVGKYDTPNFTALKSMLDENFIDLVTASPELGPAQQSMFAQVYSFQDKGRVSVYEAPKRALTRKPVEAA